MKNDHIIVGVHLKDRVHQAAKFQKVLSEYGCNIKTRLGLHEVQEDFCASGGIVLLEVVGKKEVTTTMIKKISALPGVEVKKMVFSHE